MDNIQRLETTDSQEGRNRLIVRGVSILVIIACLALAFVVGELPIFFVILLALITNEAIGYLIKGNYED